MFETLFGAEMPPALRFFIAFLVVLALIGATAWFVRRFGSERFGGTSARGRQPRLAVIDASAVDGRRRLVLIRRDNVEHLLLIGGPSDVIVETNIVRAMGAPRETTPPGRAAPAVDTLSRPAPLAEGTMWPLQPQPEVVSTPRTQRPAAAEEPALWMPPPQPEPVRPPRPADTLAGLAEEISSRPTPPREPVLRPAPEPKRAAPPVEPPQLPPGADQNLAEMAHRLEAALRGPNEPRREPAAESEPKSSMPELKATRTEPKPSQVKPAYDSLEQEMASLLGRPGKQ